MFTDNPIAQSCVSAPFSSFTRADLQAYGTPPHTLSCSQQHREHTAHALKSKTLTTLMSGTRLCSRRPQNRESGNKLGKRKKRKPGSWRLQVGSGGDPRSSVAWPVLLALSPGPRLMGPVGAASALKLALNQVLRGGQHFSCILPVSSYISRILQVKVLTPGVPGGGLASTGTALLTSQHGKAGRGGTQSHRATTGSGHAGPAPAMHARADDCS
jgi:hypothetical protein